MECYGNLFPGQNPMYQTESTVPLLLQCSQYSAVMSVHLFLWMVPVLDVLRFPSLSAVLSMLRFQPPALFSLSVPLPAVQFPSGYFPFLSLWHLNFLLWLRAVLHSFPAFEIRKHLLSSCMESLLSPLKPEPVLHGDRLPL